MGTTNHFNARATLDSAGEKFTYYRLKALEEAGLGDVSRLPFSIKVLLEASLRNHDGFVYTDAHVKALAAYDAKNVGEQEIAFMPARVVLQDFTGVPAVVDLAALRSAVARRGGDTSQVNPLVRSDLVIDHSVQVDAYGTAEAMGVNTTREFERNKERYEFLKWGQKAFTNFTVVPPETGIVHQVNLEFLAGVVLTSPTADGGKVALLDSCFGTDSHTTMINGLGVLGWGVGGIEAEAAMLGQPSYMLIPEVVGFELKGSLREGMTATDLVLTVTEMLRAHGVVGKFVEFFGDGLQHLSLADRATIANMAPEYGATCGFFPVDERTIDYLRLTGRDHAQLELVRDYAKAQGLWADPKGTPIVYSSSMSLDVATVEASLAGPTRPQDRVLLSGMRQTFEKHLAEKFQHTEVRATNGVSYNGETFDLPDGAVVIAAITSCTNTSNPGVMIAAGLVAKKAAALGLKAKPWVKTSLAPGSRVVTDYFDRANLTEALNAIGFYTVGYGCTTCIGNSGPLPEPIIEAVAKNDLVVAAVLSGNRNFEGRVSPQTKANYLASPPLCVAYAIAGTVLWDPYTEALGQDTNGKDVFLKDIWPTNAEVNEAVAYSVTTAQFKARYGNVYAGPPAWQALEAPASDVYAWSEDSTYIQEPPYFIDMPAEPSPLKVIKGARALAYLGDSITTDHISPAGAIAKGSPAALFLTKAGVERRDWNSYGSRRGNDRIMTRGTFANIRIKNRLAPGTEGGWTTYFGPDADIAAPAGLTYDSDVLPKQGEVASIYDASVKYQKHGIPLVVLAGKDYGMGSSRDWAAKGTFLLGVRAVIAESYERIHRSNLIGMGVLPLQFKTGECASTLYLKGDESFDIEIDDSLEPLSNIVVTTTSPDGTFKVFSVLARVDTPVEIEYLRNGGVLHTVLRRLG